MKYLSHIRKEGIIWKLYFYPCNSPARSDSSNIKKVPVKPFIAVSASYRSMRQFYRLKPLLKVWLWRQTKKAKVFSGYSISACPRFHSARLSLWERRYRSLSPQKACELWRHEQSRVWCRLCSLLYLCFLSLVLKSTLRSYFLLLRALIFSKPTEGALFLLCRCKYIRINLQVGEIIQLINWDFGEKKPLSFSLVPGFTVYFLFSFFFQ